MREAFLKVWENPYVRVAAYLLFFYGLFLLVARAWPALSVLLTAFAFAYLVHPLVQALERRRLPRAVGVVLVYLLLGLFLALASFLAAQTVVELSRLARDLPRLLDPLLAWLVALPDRAQAVPVPESLRPVLEELTRNLRGLLQGFLEALVRWLQGLLAQGGSLLGFFTSLLGGVFQLFTALILSAYFLYDLPRLGRAALAVFPEPYQPLAQDLAAKLNASVGGYVRGQLLVALCVGFLVGLGFWLVGVPLAASLGFLAGVFNLIPFVGVVVSGVPALLLAATGGLGRRPWPFWSWWRRTSWRPTSSGPSSWGGPPAFTPSRPSPPSLRGAPSSASGGPSSPSPRPPSSRWSSRTTTREAASTARAERPGVGFATWEALLGSSRSFSFPWLGWPERSPLLPGLPCGLGPARGGLRGAAPPPPGGFGAPAWGAGGG